MSEHGSTPDIEIRRMTIDDLDAVTAIEEATFAYLVAVKNGRVVGYAGAWIILDESHITNIAVEEGERGQGIGRKLTEALMQYISNLGAAYATLEVRVSNERAQRLYKSLGFVSVGKRKRYYEDNGEDAFLMVCEHMPDVEEDFEEA